jgi:hypothetical protein
MIFIKDDLRAQVEAASGGHVTVLYTAKGHPCYMHVVPKFLKQDIDPALGNGVHEMFIVNGEEKSERFIGQYQGILKDGELLSLPGVIPTTNINHDQARAYASANGPGWSNTTWADMAGLALWMHKNGTLPRGNTQYGRSHESPFETGRRADAGTPGDSSGNHLTYTGSGPLSWRHNHQVTGIADITGNAWEWLSGMRLMDGEIQVLPNNDAADNTKDVSSTSSLWRAIRASDGALVAPGTAGTLKYDATLATGGDPVLSDTITNMVGNAGDNTNSGNSTSKEFKLLTAKAGLTVPAIARALALFPLDGMTIGGDRLYVRNFGERLPGAGGGRRSAGGAGPFARALDNSRLHASSFWCARPAYFL